MYFIISGKFSSLSRELLPLFPYSILLELLIAVWGPLFPFPSHNFPVIQVLLICSVRPASSPVLQMSNLFISLVLNIMFFFLILLPNITTIFHILLFSFRISIFSCLNYFKHNLYSASDYHSIISTFGVIILLFLFTLTLLVCFVIFFIMSSLLQHDYFFPIRISSSGSISLECFVWGRNLGYFWSKANFILIPQPGARV